MKQIKILFVKPSPDIVNKTLDISPGILYLSSYLKKYLGSRVIIDFIDLRIEKKKDSLFRRLDDFKPDITGISLLSFEKGFLSQNVKKIRQHAPSTKIIIGGPYPTHYYEEALMEEGIDCAVIGEGEKVFLNIVNCILEGRDYRYLKGVASMRNGEISFSGREEYIEDLDTIPMPDYGLIDFKKYCGYSQHMNGILARKNKALVMSSRACPYNCIYCHQIFGKKLRKQSPEKFFSEIRYLYNEHGIREFHIVDDVFNLDRKRMHVILNLIIESGMEIRIAFPNAIRGDILEKEDILLLKKAGTYMITFAVETASERIQKLINKNLNLKKVTENIEYADSIGIICKAFFMVGFPSETVEEIYQTLDYAINSRLDMLAFFAVVPFKKTGLYELARSIYGELEGQDDWDYYCANTFYEKVTGFNIKRYHIKANFLFYTPRRMFKLFRKIEWKSYFVRRAFLSALQMFWAK